MTAQNDIHLYTASTMTGLFILQNWLNLINSRKATQLALEIPGPICQFFGKGDINSHELSNS